MQVVFPELRAFFQKSGRCPACQKRARRSRNFFQTLNPFNVNAQGRVKTRKEIYAELEASGRKWEKEPTYHAKCEP